MAPADSPVYACQSCGGHGWIVDRMTPPDLPTAHPIPTLKETA